MGAAKDGSHGAARPEPRSGTGPATGSRARTREDGRGESSKGKLAAKAGAPGNTRSARTGCKMFFIIYFSPKNYYTESVRIVDANEAVIVESFVAAFRSLPARTSRLTNSISLSTKIYQHH